MDSHQHRGRSHQGRGQADPQVGTRVADAFAALRRRLSRGAVLGLLSLCVARPAAAQPADASIPIRITTSLGTIEATLDSAHAPVTVTNFLRYIDGGFFRGGRFHRTVTLDNQPNNAVKIEVIQGAPARDSTRRNFPPIPMEPTSVTGLQHLDGTLSMARAGPNSATAEFFVCIGAQPALDFGGARNADGQGFAAFGQVTAGMDVVRAIQHASAAGQNLTPPIVILDIIRR